MIRFLLNKLGRDNSLKLLTSQNIKVTYKILEGEDLIRALSAKLIEEALEVQEATDEKELVAELADVLEVIKGLCKAYGISMDDVEKVREQKFIEKGGFGGFYVETIEMDENNPRVSHFRKSPLKYPEIKEDNTAL